MPRPTQQAFSNRILRALDPQTFERVSPRLERVTLEQRDILHDYDKPIEHVYFPENCVGSVVGVMADASAVETATIGFEGMVGIMLFFGTDRMAAQAFCQVPGEAYRMQAAEFRQIITTPTVHSMLGRYTQALFTQVGQSSACNRMHAMTQRCARWLLQTHDRVHADEFTLTQDFLAQMLGVRRATVTEAAGALQDAGVIAYKHGRITMLDRPRLEGMCCECYSIIAREYDRLIDLRDRPSPLEHVRMSENGRSTVQPPTRVAKAIEES
jgi:CRP-like cAMP-binding protein